MLWGIEGGKGLTLTLRRRKQRQKFFVTVRDYTMIVFLLGTGVRLGELILNFESTPV